MEKAALKLYNHTDFDATTVAEIAEVSLLASQEPYVAQADL
ncbi:hypothetical protein [Streptomyces sp. NPDC016845]